MSSFETISLRGGFSVLAEELVRLRVRNFKPVMEAIKTEYIAPLAKSAWAGSGLHSRSGELARSITPFAGKVSVGVGLRTTKGKDLVLAKAATHTYGRKKWSSKRGVNRKNRKYRRRSPWGDIPARPFIPDALPPGVRSAIETKVVDYINDQLG